MDPSESDRDPVDELAEEFVERCRRGERPSVEEYASRHPERADKIRALFPALLVMECARPDSREQSGLGSGGGPVQPERLGDYRIIGEVGRGGMGVVYEAEQESLGRHVALKVLSAPSLLDPRHLQRFKREARAAARLHHTNIVPVHGVGEQDGLHYYVMQFIRGQGLDQVLAELRRLRLHPADPTAPTTGVHLPGQAEGSSLSEGGRAYWLSVAQVGLQVADALGYAATQGVLHRDVKPANLLLDNGGTVWVTDFGLAKAETDVDDVTLTGDVVGTLRYMAPERFRGEADIRSDLYALGLTLYELLTLRPAFNETDRNKLVAQVLHDTPPRPRKLDAGIPRDLETVVLKAIEKEPARRYQTPAELAEDLQRFLDGRPIKARRLSAAQHAWRWCRRNPALSGLTAGLILVLLGGMAGVGWQWLRADHHARDAEAKRRKTHEMAREYFTRVSENKLLGKPGLQDLRKELLGSSLHYYQEFLAERGEDPEMRADVAATHARMAIILDQTGSKDEARAAFEDALAAYEKMIEGNPGDLKAVAGLARTHNQLGELYVRMSALDQALDSLNRSRDILERVSGQDPENFDFQSELARTHRHIAAVQARKDQRAAAFGSFDQAAAFGRRLVQADRQRSEFRTDLASTYHARGDLHVAAGEIAAALDAFSQARDLLQPLAQNRPADIELQSLLADNEGRIANAYSHSGRVDEALQLWMKVRDVRERIAYENPVVTEYQWELALAYCFLGKQHSYRKEFAEALACWQQALPFVERLIRVNPNVPDYQVRLADLHNDNAHLYSKMGRQADALRSFELAWPILERLVRDYPDTATYRYNLAVNRHNNGKELREIGRREEARQSLERSRVLCSELIAKDASVLAYSSLLVNVHNKLGLLHADAKDPGRAAACFRLALEDCLKLHRAQPLDPFYGRLLGICYANLGSASRAANEPAEAERHLRQAYDIREKLGRDHADLTDAIREAAEASRDLASLLRETGKTQEALSLYERARDQARKAFQANPLDLRARSVEGEAWDGIGLLLAPMGRPDEAIQAHRKAIEMQKAAVAKEPEQLVYRERMDKHVQNLARLYHDLGRPADAAALLRELGQTPPVKP